MAMWHRYIAHIGQEIFDSKLLPVKWGLPFGNNAYDAQAHSHHWMKIKKLKYKSRPVIWFGKFHKTTKKFFFIHFRFQTRACIAVHVYRKCVRCSKVEKGLADTNKEQPCIPFSIMFVCRMGESRHVVCIVIIYFDTLHATSIKW